MIFTALRLFVAVLASCIGASAAASVLSCSEGPYACLPSSGCSESCGKASNQTSNPWICVTVPPGNHYVGAAEEVALVEGGYKGLAHVTELSYRVVFHNNTLNYPCQKGWCSNENKLFGFSRGFVEVMWESCMFAWRSTSHIVSTKEPANKIMLWGYGWYNSTMKPWEHPKQNPFMGYLDVNVPYVLQLKGFTDYCTYTVQSVDGRVLASARTPQQPPAPGPSYYFSLYFGGEETTTAPVTVSYTRDLWCAAVRV